MKKKRANSCKFYYCHFFSLFICKSARKIKLKSKSSIIRLFCILESIRSIHFNGCECILRQFLFDTYVWWAHWWINSCTLNAQCTQNVYVLMPLMEWQIVVQHPFVNEIVRENPFYLCIFHFFLCSIFFSLSLSFFYSFVQWMCTSVQTTKPLRQRYGRRRVKEREKWCVGGGGGGGEGVKWIDDYIIVWCVCFVLYIPYMTMAQIQTNEKARKCT